jgi:ABC-2 type transport system ATP-binding protein
MDHGRILAQGTLEELIRLVGEKEIVEITGGFAAAVFSEALKDLVGNGIELLSAADNLAALAVSDTEQIPKIMDRLFRKKLAVNDLKIKSPNLETVFLKLTGRSLRD